MIPTGWHRTLLLVMLLVVAAAPAARSEPRNLVITDELQLGLAEMFMVEGEYYRAITEYKKFLYFFPDAEHTGYVQLQIGMAYYHGGECPQAIDAFSKVRQHYPSGQFAAAAFYEGVCRSRLKNFQAAQDSFARVIAYDPASPQAADALAGMSLSAIDREDWEGSRQTLQRLADNYPDLPRGAAARDALPLLEEVADRPRKSPVVAGTMSALIPGSGQAYAGRYRDGLTAFLINGLFIAGTAVAIDQGNYATAAVVGGIGLPFYLGNIYGAANAANLWNLSLHRDLRDRLAVTLDYRY